MADSNTNAHSSASNNLHNTTQADKQYEIYHCPDCKPETRQYLEDAKARAQELAEYHRLPVTVYKRKEGGLLEYIGHATPFSFGGV